MRSGTVLLLSIVLCLPQSPLRACDPDHQWQEEQALTRRMIPSRPLRRVGMELGRDLIARGLVRPGSLVALAGVEVDDPGEGDTREAARSRAVGALSTGLELAGLAVLGPDRVAASLARAGLRAGAPSPGAAAALSRDGVQACVIAGVRSGEHMTRVDRDLRASNAGLFCQYVFETVHARLKVEDAAGRTVLMRPAIGVCRDGFLFFAGERDGLGTVVEYHVDRPGSPSLRFEATPGRSHLGL